MRCESEAQRPWVTGCATGVSGLRGSHSALALSSPGLYMVDRPLPLRLVWVWGWLLGGYIDHCTCSASLIRYYSEVERPSRALFLLPSGEPLFISVNGVGFWITLPTAMAPSTGCAANRRLASTCSTRRRI